MTEGAGYQGDDALVVAPHQYRVESENELVRVIRVRYEPGDRSPLHSHPALAGVIVNLTDGLLRSIDDDGTARDAARRAGQVALFPAQAHRHQIENIGQAPFEALRIEIKST